MQTFISDLAAKYKEKERLSEEESKIVEKFTDFVKEQISQNPVVSQIAHDTSMEQDDDYQFRLQDGTVITLPVFGEKMPVNYTSVNVLNSPRPRTQRGMDDSDRSVPIT